MRYFLIYLVLLPLFSYGQKLSKSEIQADRKIINEALHNQTTSQIFVHQVIPDKATVMRVAEPILFKVYGKEQITSERPYVANLVDGYWIMSGTLPQGWMGGTFLIIISAKYGRVIKVAHYK